MAVQSLHLRNFTVFADARLEFCPGVNVLLGENGTGKSHVLKAMYAMGRGFRERRDESAVAKFQAAADLDIALANIFAPAQHEVSRLNRRGSRRPFAIELAWLGGSIGCTADDDDLDEFHWEGQSPGPPSLFLPPREVLSMYPNFRRLYEKYQLAFDGTYYDLIVTLGDPLRRELPAWAKEIVSRLEAQLGGRVVLKGERFFIEKGDGAMEISLEAEGLRKLAMVLQLLYVGAIEPGGLLLWDEPEANMNPRLLLVMKELLLSLARAGVQIVLATHDYLLSRELSLAAEYEGAGDLVRFFCLYKQQLGEAVRVESGATLSDLPHDPIVAEFTAQYEREAALFNRPPTAVPQATAKSVAKPVAKPVRMAAKRAAKPTAKSAPKRRQGG